MTRTRMIGWTAMAVAVIGYASFAAVVLAAREGWLSLAQAAAAGGAAAVIGEVGLWVGAGCLGLSMFKKRKAMFDRLFRRRSSENTAA